MSASSENHRFLGGAWSALPEDRVAEGENLPLELAVERRWIEAAAQGDDEAFARLVRYHQDSIHRFCQRWLGDPHEAQEAAQDVFVRAYAALDRYEPRGRFSTWLYRIALNGCRDRLKSKASRERRRTDPLGSAGKDAICPTHAPDEASAVTEEREKLWRGIEALPDRSRAVVILRGIEGLAQEECAEILGCSERAVEGRYYRARRELEEWWASQP